VQGLTRELINSHEKIVLATAMLSFRWVSPRLGEGRRFGSITTIIGNPPCHSPSVSCSEQRWLREQLLRRAMGLLRRPAMRWVSAPYG
jgi:hypothetical protein